MSTIYQILDTRLKGDRDLVRLHEARRPFVARACADGVKWQIMGRYATRESAERRIARMKAILAENAEILARR